MSTKVQNSTVSADSKDTTPRWFQVAVKDVAGLSWDFTKTGLYAARKTGLDTYELFNPASGRKETLNAREAKRTLRTIRENGKVVYYDRAESDWLDSEYELFI